MKILFILKCFALGMSAASGVGPIFVLTFNRGALKGLGRGIATAFGSALGDALLFFFGLLGVLSILENTKNIRSAFDLIGGLSLVVMGSRMLYHAPRYSSPGLNAQESYTSTIIKSFLLTVINPLAVFFFLVVSVQLLPQGKLALPFRQIIAASASVGLGSLAALSCVALIASKVGKSLSLSYLLKISYVTGIVFIGIGIYFLGNATVTAFNFIR